MVKEVLLRLKVHVGLMERYSDALHVFEAVTGRQIPGRTIVNRNQNPNRPSLDSISHDLKARIRRQSLLDSDLYAFAQELFETEVARLGAAPVYTFSNVLFDDPEKARDLQERGYTIQPFLDADQIHKLSLLHHKTTPAVPSDYYISALGKDLDTKRRIFEGITAVVQDKVKRLAPGYQILMASFVTKRANSQHGIIGIHQDYSFVDKHAGPALNLWSPLCDVNSRNACLRVVEGSHAFAHISTTPTNPGPYRDVSHELDSHYTTEFPMSAGSAFLFDSCLWHGTKENQTDFDRTSVLLNLVPTNVTPLLYQWNKQQPDTLEVYEIDSEFLLRFSPDVFMENAEQLGWKLVGRLDYKCEILKADDLPRLLSPRHSVSVQSQSENHLTPGVSMKARLRALASKIRRLR